MQFIFATSFVSERAIYALSWTLLHSFWQGIVLALVAGLIMLLCRKAKASARYNLLSGALLLFVIGVGISGLIQWQYQTELLSHKPLVINYPDQEVDPIATFRVGEEVVARVWAESRMHTFVAFFNRYTFVIVALWMLILGIKSIRMGMDLWYLRRVCTYRTHVPHLYWRNRMETLAEQLRISIPVQLLESELIKSPSAIGFFKPIVLVPLGLLNSLPTEQVEAILLHELAHIRRNDYLINFVQCLFENVFFFNPGLLWVSRLIRKERENCCDDIAVAAMNSKTHYINALVAFQEFNLNASKYALAFAGQQKMPLLDRVKRIINHHNYKTLSIMEKISLLASVLLISTVTFLSLNKSQAQSIKENHIPSFTNINVSGNGTAGNPQIMFLQDANGKTYSVKRVDKKIQEMYVNGEKLSEDKYSDYEAVIKEIDEQMERDRAQAEEDRKQAERDREQAVKDRQQADRDREQAMRDQEQAKLDREQAEKDRAQAERDREQAGRDKERALRDEAQSKLDREQAVRDRQQAERDREQAGRDRAQAELDRVQAEKDRKQAEEDRKMLLSLVEDMIKDKLVKDKESINSFKLSNDEFLINGVKQSAELHAKYKAKYVKQANYQINYGNNGFRGNGLWFSKGSLKE
ncbi:M56 family metallopeptidase [Haliscomenobacter hydrossis]|uniref:Peptidase M56 BlaR1 n=1 Tax=Haliscomenobacter hydrossis (strain ATCC 27775 / DSM 1100 / LMG 10767 / O) TaxID=760192 RepID=F4L538_HALH1|nr:M56 family metallopeptidase [Haliscomenobacter hydrossis]AEE48759.1 peptidase M56 BlaR1 [Haliscomenobacter hydrossis DSM 1100]